MLSQFVRAQLLLVLISGTAYTILLASLRVPYAFALGAIGGLLEFIPLVGPLLAAALILGISFSLNYPHLLVLIIFLGAWRMCTDYVISPRVLGGKVEISTLAVDFWRAGGRRVGGGDRHLSLHPGAGHHSYPVEALAGLPSAQPEPEAPKRRWRKQSGSCSSYRGCHASGARALRRCVP